MRIRRRRGRRSPWKALLFTVLLIVLALFANQRFRPVIESVTENEAKIKAVGVINSAVLEETKSDSDLSGELTSVERDSSGRVLSVTSDVTRMNRLKARIITSVQQALNAETGYEVMIPLGTLLGGTILHGIGPEIPIKLTLSGNVSAEFKSTFESVGINQTRHRITLDVGASVYSFLPGFNTTTDVTTSVLVEETVIVGTVPAVVADLK